MGGDLKSKTAAVRALALLHEFAADDLLEYGRRLRFSPELIDACARTLIRSIELGDGALWSDSLLVSAITSPEGALRAMFDRFPGYRTSEFKTTLATQHLIVRPEFQSELTQILLAQSSKRRKRLSVEGLFEAELRWALESYRDDHSVLSAFVSKLSRRIRRIDGSNKFLRRMGYLIEDIVVLALMTNTHPFDALSRAQPPGGGQRREAEDSRPFAEGYSRGDFRRARRRFYFQLRDAANVPPALLSDGDLDAVARAFSYEHFAAVLESVRFPLGSERNVAELLRGELCSLLPCSGQRTCLFRCSSTGWQHGGGTRSRLSGRCRRRSF